MFAGVNARLLFQILYNQQSVEVQGNLKRKLINQLQPDTEYSFVLTSRGHIAGGLQQQVSIRTAPDLIKTKPSKHLAHGNRITISLPAVQTSAHIRSVLAPLRHHGNSPPAEAAEMLLQRCSSTPPQTLRRSLVIGLKGCQGRSRSSAG